VSRKICPRAVGRNRLKRLVRESFRRHQADLASEGGVDIVVLPSRYAASQSNEALGASLERHWQRCVVRPNSGAANKTEGKH
jgi:ribonuclease P protein component